MKQCFSHKEPSLRGAFNCRDRRGNTPIILARITIEPLLRRVFPNGTVDAPGVHYANNISWTRSCRPLDKHHRGGRGSLIRDGPPRCWCVLVEFYLFILWSTPLEGLALLFH